MVGFCNQIDLCNTVGVPPETSSKWIPKNCVLWELGWVEESVDLLTLVLSLDVVADRVTTLTRLWKEVTIVSPTGLYLSFFL